MTRCARARCGKLFEPSRLGPRQRFCSDNCRQREDQRVMQLARAELSRRHPEEYEAIRAAVKAGRQASEG